MNTPSINTTKSVVPMIYAYTTPGVTYHEGWIKIGYTEQEVEHRLKQQTHTADIEYHEEWRGMAVFEDGSAQRFSDKQFHSYLRKNGVEQQLGKNNEWFKIDGNSSRKLFYEFKSNHGILNSLNEILPYSLRSEQNEAVEKTIKYFSSVEDPEFLWNAKPRFGKTLTTYDLIKRLKAKSVLIVTNRPAIANSWYDDYVNFMGTPSGYAFVSEVDALKGKTYVVSRNDYVANLGKNNLKCIEFLSLQDLKGSLYFGGNYDKLKEVSELRWDLLVIDEAHEGVDTLKTDVAFDKINRKFTLFLSGTPFKALANNKFPAEAIYNYTYADEQLKKNTWNDTEHDNPYKYLPKLNLFTYQMSEIIKDELKQGIEIEGETVEYAFDLNEFFATDSTGKFIHSSSVDKFLDALTRQTKFPFSTEVLRNELKHTLWLLNRVDSAKALENKLKNHPVFSEYKVILAVGNGKTDLDSENKKNYDKVVNAIKNNEKTITLSVGQLTTGVTIPEWTGVLMLSNIQSPSLYMQAAFRAQNPCLFQKGDSFKRKENAYVFDFDPARTLIIFEEFANDLSVNTAAGSGDTDTRKNNIKQLLNFFPVIGEDENGELIELDAEKVLSIPRKIKSMEVVRRGFMSNFLFQNINNIFSAPKEIIDIIEQFEPVDEPKNKGNLSEEVKKDLHVDENGNVNLSDKYVIGQTNDVFGKKVYGFTEDNLQDAIDDSQLSEEDSFEEDVPTSIDSEKLKEHISNNYINDVINTAKNKYGDDLKKSDSKRIEANLNQQKDEIVDKAVADYNIKQKIIEQEKADALKDRFNTNQSTEKIEEEFQKKQNKAYEDFKSDISSKLDEFVKKAPQETVREAETAIKEREKNLVSDGIRDHLRGFSRTIPSFLMAYGDDSVTLATFDQKVPDKVFLEVTSITLDQFRLLRDGGKYIDIETGEPKNFEGNLFNPIVFDDSIKEFLRLKKKLSDYFDENSVEDIFDYIPPQKTNQIFTPKDIVKRMVDMLEDENPGCFDMPDKTFIDLYMKSGLYIAEIVKRIYQSKRMKELFPSKEDRLKHIFEKQVYGLAPTEIIYRIATSFLLGFDKDVNIEKHNFRKVDATPFSKEGKLKEKLDELFGEKN